MAKYVDDVDIDKLVCRCNVLESDNRILVKQLRVAKKNIKILEKKVEILEQENFNLVHLRELQQISMIKKESGGNL